MKKISREHLLMDESDQRTLKVVVEILKESFVWHKSPQGREYWVEVCKHLSDLANLK